MPNDLRPKLGINRTDHHWWIIQRKDALATSQLPEEACIHPDLQIVFIQAWEEFLPDVRCHHFFGIQHRRHDSALEPGQTRVGITPTNLMPPRKSGFHTTKIPQQIHQSIRANRHLMRFLLQNISKYFYLDGSSHTLTCSYNLRPKNEFDLAQLRGRHACMRGRSLLTPLGQPLI